ncbi:MAG: GNAT family N-acetyltransferase [Candidatus Hodarchaeales archaeon]|jgi:ribosomal protein S18 acetylase RimI-like enzyme
MKIKQIFAKNFPENKKIIFTYQSDYYYDVQITQKDNNEGWIFDWSIKPFLTTFMKKEEEKLFESYKENVEYYVVLNANEEIGYLVVGRQEWNNVARIWDISIDAQFQRQAIGTELMQLAETRAKKWKCRALILECQSSNYTAIQFYLKCGFSLTGFDLISYSNQDVQRHDIRLEMSKLLE